VEIIDHYMLYFGLQNIAYCSASKEIWANR